MAAQTTKDQLRDYIIDIIKTKEPKTTQELLKIAREKYNCPETMVLDLLMQLEEENSIQFTKKEALQPKTLPAYIFSSNSIWYLLTLILATTTIAAVFLIPENAYPLTYVRQFLGTIFVLFLPGFVFMRTLYPSKVPLETSSEKLDKVERIALSIGLSITIVAITGLILNYTPWGIRLTPITLSLFALTIIFATASFLRSHYETSKRG